MSKRIELDVEYESLNTVILQDLIDHFEHSEADIETINALALVIKFYASDVEWKAFSKKNGL